jgi:DNA processing protein
MEAIGVNKVAQPGGDDASLAAWLTLLHCPGIGPRRYSALLAYYQAPHILLDAGPSEINRLDLPRESKKWLSQPDLGAVEADLAWLHADPQHHIITLADARYPQQLRETDSAPPLLFVNGNPDLLNTPQLGMVGSRNPSSGGRENAFNFARSLSQAGLTITSGLALGIDSAAHEGALSATGLTIGVTGTGLDRVYPARNRKLAHEIAARGALVSEFPTGTQPLADHFPRRNRIISGLSLGVLVVEAAPKSGSLITARFASEQGREVFAIPGSIHNPLARGCHSLIRQGAKLVETTDDILEELGLTTADTAAPQTTLPTDQDLDNNSMKLLSFIGHDPVSIDILVERSNLTPEAVSAILLALELRGVVSSPAGGLYIKAS